MRPRTRLVRKRDPRQADFPWLQTRELGSRRKVPDIRNGRIGPETGKDLAAPEMRARFDRLQRLGRCERCLPPAAENPPGRYLRYARQTSLRVRLERQNPGKRQWF